MSVCTTEGIRISVNIKYLVDESEPDQHKFVFAYQVTIENRSAEAAQLLTRHWVIKDAHNNIEEVKGEGVVGQTPVIQPGNSFTYSSWCPLRTDWGIMRGAYGMTRPSGSLFDAQIAPFALLPPHMLN